MKKFIGTGLVILLSFAVFGCCASKVKAQNEAPFKVLEATYTNWAGEQPDKIGTTLRITINNKEIQLDSVYFRNNSASLKRVDSIENAIFTGSFTTSTIPHDYILHSDPKEEFGNKPPVTVSKLPFEIKENEAVVSYFFKDKINYYKILEVKQE
ncbi:MAG: hypothetical protein A3F91_14905 [Flavobacteria bacterium RIFCSPLOWO2_12_FULL_35_11]|nr:MAG: hypothetical protein A3F91_14905 [Flavobacteria bacterium RIFCSPLOWO2_12_FULL_35_11]